MRTVLIILSLSFLLLSGCADDENLYGGAATTGSDVVLIDPSELVFENGEATMNIFSTDVATYAVAYYSIEGAPWTEFRFTGDRAVGSWFLFGAEATITFPETLFTESDSPSFLAIFTCKRDNEEWDCYGNNWQVYTFTAVLDGMSCADDQCEADGVCFDALSGHPTDGRLCLEGSWIALPGEPGQVG